MENAPHARRPLGQMLVDRGLLEPKQLDHALAEQAQTRQPLGSVLIALDYVDESTLRTVMLAQCGRDMTRQNGFGSGLLGELERRGVGRPAVPEPARGRVGTLLETFGARSRTLSAELGTVRRLLHEITR